VSRDLSNLIEWILRSTSPQMVGQRVRSASFHAGNYGELKQLQRAGRRALSDLRDARIRIGGRR
jgi:hypothetical protein